MRSHSYINSVKKIIELYYGSLPLAAWLKDYFRNNKKFGSKDRKEIGHATYCYYRLGNAFSDLDQEERILRALFLCSDSPNFILQELKPAWNDEISASLEQKLSAIDTGNELRFLFPFTELLSDEIDVDAFTRSHLIQPLLFLRIRPGGMEKVQQALDAAGVVYKLNGSSASLPNGTRVGDFIQIDKHAVIQDLNSQKTLDQLQLQNTDNTAFTSAWDCCAASGGKSILFHDHYPSAHLTVSDIRESILANLTKRFALAGIGNYTGFITDLSSSSLNKTFDLVICDAPCSGSGTWSRIPEQIVFFKNEKLEYYSSLQKRISVNAARSVKSGGCFLYITCSVFSQENEEVVEHIRTNTRMQLLSQAYLKGYDKRADTLFTALFRSVTESDDRKKMTDDR